MKPGSIILAVGLVSSMVFNIYLWRESNQCLEMLSPSGECAATIQVNVPDIEVKCGWEFICPKGGCNNLEIHAVSPPHVVIDAIEEKMEGKDDG